MAQPAARLRTPTPPVHPPLWLTGVGLVAVSVNLRTIMASVPPLLRPIAHDLGLSNAWLGALTTLPVLCMGVFAPLAQQLSKRVGPARAVLVATVTVLLGCVLRYFGGEVWPLFLGAFVGGVGIAIGGTLLPGLVKQLCPPERVGVMTGLYMVALMGGAAVSSALSVPLAHALGSWEASLLSWAVLALVGVLVWIPVMLRVRGARPAGAPAAATPAAATTAAATPATATPAAATTGAATTGAATTAAATTAATTRPPAHGLPWRAPTAWLIAGYLAAQSWQFYSSLAWVAPTFVARGWSAQQAGYLLSVFAAAQVVSGLLGPALTDTVRDRRVLLIPAALLGLVGELGLWLAPDAMPWGWVVVLGFGQGGAFSLALVLLVDYAATPAASARLAAMAFTLSYTVASLGPAAMGAVRDASGGFAAVWLVLALVVAPQAAFVWALSPHREPVP